MISARFSRVRTRAGRTSLKPGNFADIAYRDRNFSEGRDCLVTVIVTQGNRRLRRDFGIPTRGPDDRDPEELPIIPHEVLVERWQRRP